MKDSKYRFYIDGVLVNNPVEWLDIEVLATFDNDSIQNNVSVSDITIPLDGNDAVRKWIADGNIFEGLPFDIVVENGAEATLVNNYLLDFSNIQVLEDNKVTVSFKFADGLNQIADRLEGISFGWLESQGKITKDDYETINYVVVNPDKSTELLIVSLTLFLLAKHILDFARNTAEDGTTSLGIGLAGITGPAGASAYKFTMLAVNILYFAGLSGVYGLYFKQLFDLIIPKARKHKVISYKTLLEKVGDYLGYPVQTNIPLERYFYLPSNPNQDEFNVLNGFIKRTRGTQKGIPNTGDYGYNLTEFIDLIKTLFNAKIAVVDGVLHFRNVDDEFWRRTATFTLREDTFIESFSYNNADLKANVLYKFVTDVTDTYTITNFKGTNYEVITAGSDSKRSLVKGVKQVDFKVALGSKKSGLTGFENTLKDLAGAVDAFLKVFKVDSSFRARLSLIGNALLVSNNNHTIPKILYLNENFEIPNNHRDLLSAKALYNQYYKSESFVANNGYGQKKIYNNVRIPFGYAEWLQVSQNSYIKDNNGRVAKIIELRWNVGSDYAEIDFWVREPYTNKLTENFVEA